MTRFQPFRDLVNTDPFREFEDLFRDFRLLPALRGVDAGPRIRMDISETEQAYRVTADIPGVKKEDIKISVDGNKVTISAEVKREASDPQGGNVLGSERFYGQQYRSFTLAQEVDESKADASYQDGVLELTLPKKPDSGGRQLTVH